MNDVDESSLHPIDFVRRHHVHYDVRDEVVVVDDQRVKVGYRLRLWGVLPTVPDLLPDEAPGSPLAHGLSHLAEHTMPPARGRTQVLIDPPGPALYDSRVVSGADEIAVDVRIVTGELDGVPAGRPEEDCLKAMRKELEHLGARQRD